MRILAAVFWVKVYGTVKMEVVTISVTSVPRYRTSRRHGPEHETLLLQTQQLAADQNLTLEASLHTQRAATSQTNAVR